MFTPRRVVIGATAHAELATALRSVRPTLEFRGNRAAELTTGDLDWGDTYVGFRRPPLPTMGNIRWVHCTGAGVDSWVYPVELPRDILLTRTSESFGPAIAEWALARALAFTQHLPELAEAQARREWVGRDPALMRGTTAVICGTGDVGTHIARLFAAVGCQVIGVSRSGRGNPNAFSRVVGIASLGEVAGLADWLVLALPLTDETRGLINHDVLELCNGAILINAGRGAVVEEGAIPDALDRGRLRGAALDVFEVEPLPKESPLWSDRRVMISPHISGPTTVNAAVEGFLECLTSIERGEPPRWVVNRERQY